jgi:tetratricopeptide (TPR) repeat protein
MRWLGFRFRKTRAVAQSPIKDPDFASRLPSTDASSSRPPPPSAKSKLLETPTSDVVPAMRELVGPRIMDFESLGARYTPEQLSEFKKAYSDFLGAAVKALRNLGYKEPKIMDELLELCDAAISNIWSNFNPKSTNSLIDGFSRKKDGALGTLDCDTSAYVVADILSQFGVNTKLVALPGHVILHLDTAAGAIYLETVPHPHFYYYSSNESFEKKYPISFGECDFQAGNYISYMNRGRGRVRDYAGAIEDFSRAIELNPNSAEAYDSRGIAKEGLGDCAGAIEDFSRAIDLNPKYVDAYYNRGFVLRELGAYNSAIEDFSSAIELNPNSAEAYNRRGVAKAERGDREGAIEDYSRALELNPKDAFVYFSRGVLGVILGAYKRAIKDYSKAIELNPEFASAYNNRGFAKARRGDLKGAIKDYSKAIELDPEFASAYNNRGTAKARRGDRKGAIEDFSRAIDLNPNYAMAYNNRGVAKGKLGDAEGAQSDFDMAKKLRNAN